MKFAHIGDCHLGGWRQPELQALNFQSFQYAVDKCIKEAVDFILIAGDLFDSAYPPIETLKETFKEFSKIKEAKIPVFIIAGSHDYSASGKTFLDVLSHAGFCINATKVEEHKGSLLLNPVLHKGIAIYGYPGKKSGLEVDDIAKISLNDSPGMFKILMLHTTIKDAIGSLPIAAVDEKKLPKVDYLALSHLHIYYQKENRAYSGPIFPNNLQELEELKGGSFIIFDNGKLRRELIKIKEILPLTISINNALTATEKIISELDSLVIKDKIIILNLFGTLEQGSMTDIDFQKIESYAKGKGAFSFIKSASKIYQNESELIVENVDSPDIESYILDKFIATNPHKYNPLSPALIKSLQVAKMDEEKAANFEDRLLSEVKKIIQI